jgi:hypothetical protein
VWDQEQAGRGWALEAPASWIFGGLYFSQELAQRDEDKGVNSAGWWLARVTIHSDLGAVERGNLSVFIETLATACAPHFPIYGVLCSVRKACCTLHALSLPPGLPVH